MARDVVINGQTYKQRNIFAVWLGLPLVTLGVYTYVWYYKINDEARRFLGDASVKPGVSVIALLFGWLLILPPFISVYRTAGRIGRMQRHVGITDSITPWIAVLLMFVFGLHTLYLQSQLNRIWERQRSWPATPQAFLPPQPTPAPSTVPAPPPPPPPPPQ